MAVQGASADAGIAAIGLISAGDLAGRASPSAVERRRRGSRSSAGRGVGEPRDGSSQRLHSRGSCPGGTCERGAVELSG